MSYGSEVGAAVPSVGWRNQWIYNVLLSFVVVLVCLLLGELALRQWLPLDNVVLQPDTRYLYKFIPNSRQLIRPVTASGAPTVLITINSQGRRGELVTKDQNYRVMVYGDSFIAALNTPLKQTFVSQLEQLLSAKFPQPVHVINAGVPGYGPDQESLVMEDEIDSIRPNLVVFALYSGNDFGDLVRDKLFQLDERQRLVSNHPVLDPALVQGFEKAYQQQPKLQTIRRATNFLGMLRSGERPSEPSARGLLDAWQVQCQKEYANYALEHDNQVHNLFEDAYDVDISTAPRSDSARYKVALMEGMIDRIQRIAAKRSVPLIFLLIPSPIDVLDQWDISVDGGRFPEYRRDTLTGVLERIVRDRNLYYLNLFEPFRSHQAENLYYHGLDDHWNATGEHLAATLMVDYISRTEALRGALTQ